MQFQNQGDDVLGSNLKKVMKDLYDESVLDIFQKPSEKKYIDTVTVPKFNERGVFKTAVTSKIINFKKIVSNHEAEIMKLPSYKIASIFLKEMIRKKDKLFKEKLVLNIDSVVKKSIFDFIISFLCELDSEHTSSSAFENNFKKFQKFFDNELFTVFCFVTVRNFDSDSNFIQLSPKQILRVRTADEFNTISSIKKLHSYQDLDPNFHKIKFIVGTVIPKTHLDENTIFNTFSCFLHALKIFHSGDIQFGGAYYRDSVDWDVKPIICLKREPILIHKKKYKLENKTYSKNDFLRFYNKFSKINFTKGKYTFLGRSITRFSYATDNESMLDKIVDYITSLESLYSSNEQSLSFKFAMRITLALGHTSKQKVLLHEFISEIYRLRSKIVHGDKIHTVVIKDHTLNIDDCILHLENISRNSIKLFLHLISESYTKEQLHREIDDSVYDLSLQKQFQNISKKLKLPQINILNL